MNEWFVKAENSLNHLTVDDLANLDESELLLLFLHKSWKHMNESARLLAMQEVENRRAQVDGRPPAQVRVADLDHNQLGEFESKPDGSSTIFINSRFLKPSKIFASGDTSIFNAASALSTLLHEGRHAYQDYMIENDLGMVPDQQQLEWAAVYAPFGGLYCNDDPVIYLLQSIEMDARRFARRMIAQVDNFFNATGKADRNFESQVALDIQREARLIGAVRERLDHDKIDQYEKEVLDYFGRNQPTLDLTNLRLFDHARFILDHPEITDPMQMIEALDRMADEKLCLKDAEHMNRVQDIEADSLGQMKG